MRRAAIEGWSLISGNNRVPTVLATEVERFGVIAEHDQHYPAVEQRHHSLPGSVATIGRQGARKKIPSVLGIPMNGRFAIIVAGNDPALGFQGLPNGLSLRIAKRAAELSLLDVVGQRAAPLSRVQSRKFPSNPLATSCGSCWSCRRLLTANTSRDSDCSRRGKACPHIRQRRWQEVPGTRRWRSIG